MKKVLFIILLLTCANSFAQKITVEGSFEAIKDYPTLKVEMEFQEILGMSVEDFAVYETDWEKDKPEIIDNFLTSAAENIQGLLFNPNFNTPYTLRIIVSSITRVELMCSADLIDEAGNVVGQIDNFIYRKNSAVGGTKLHALKKIAYFAGADFGVSFCKVAGRRRHFLDNIY